MSVIVNSCHRYMRLLCLLSLI